MSWDLRLMVFLISFALCSLPVMAVTNDNITAYYALDTIPGFLNDSSPNLLHFYNNTGTDQNTTKFKLGNASAMFIKGQTDEMITGVPPMVGDKAAVSFWFYTDDLTQNSLLLGDWYDSISVVLENNDVWCQAKNNSNAINITLNPAIAADNWVFAWCSVNGSHVYGGTNAGAVVSAAFTGDLDGDDNLSMSHWNNMATPGQFGGLIDEIAVFNTSAILASDAAVLYAGGAGCNPFDNESCAWVNVDVTIFLIDERNGSAFDINNVTSVTVYSDENLRFATFTGDNISFPLDLTVTTKYHVDIEYNDGTIITRWLDYDLTGSSVRVCANTDDVTHYEQLVIAGGVQEAVMTNVFADCLVGADDTRFGYQNAYVLRAITIPALYSLVTYDSDGNMLTLAGLDGSISSYYDLDTLIFASTQADIQVAQESLTTEKTGNTTVKIYYQNLADDNTAITVTITRMDNDTVVYLSNDFADPNEFTIYFDYSTQANITNNSIFMITVDTVSAAGTDRVIRYFNVAASQGFMNSQLAFTISVLIMIFGLTLTIARIAFSWFGIFMVLTALAVASSAPSTWYLLFLQAIEVVIFIYIGILAWIQNPVEVT